MILSRTTTATPISAHCAAIDSEVTPDRPSIGPTVTNPISAPGRLPRSVLRASSTSGTFFRAVIPPVIPNQKTSGAIANSTRRARAAFSMRSRLSWPIKGSRANNDPDLGLKLGSRSQITSRPRRADATRSRSSFAAFRRSLFGALGDSHRGSRMISSRVRPTALRGRANANRVATSSPWGTTVMSAPTMRAMLVIFFGLRGVEHSTNSTQPSSRAR